MFVCGSGIVIARTDLSEEKKFFFFFPLFWLLKLRCLLSLPLTGREREGRNTALYQALCYSSCSLKLAIGYIILESFG